MLAKTKRAETINITHQLLKRGKAFAKYMDFFAAISRVERHAEATAG